MTKRVEEKAAQPRDQSCTGHDHEQRTVTHDGDVVDSFALRNLPVGCRGARDPRPTRGWDRVTGASVAK